MALLNISQVCFLMSITFSCAFLTGETGSQQELVHEVETLRGQLVVTQGQMQELTSELSALQENSDCSCMALTKVSMCPDGWTLHNNSCYFYYVFPQTWDDARKTCERLGGHLVAIETMAEDTFVKGFIDMSKTKSGRTNDKYVWLGATDHLSEGAWLWVTGESVALQDWRGGHVEHADNDGHPGVEDCMDYSDGAWNDNHCTSTLPSLCEKEAAFKSV